MNMLYVASESLAPNFNDLKCHLVLFENVSNANDLDIYVKTPQMKSLDVHDKTQESTPHQTITKDFHLFLNPHMLCTTRHVFLAVLRALEREKNKQLRAKTVQTEVLLSLTPSSQIAECFNVFGFHPTSKEILAVIVLPDHPSSIQRLETICNMIHGTQVNTHENLGHFDYFYRDRLIKHLDLDASELSLPGGIEAAILSRIAIKGI